MGLSGFSEKNGLSGSHCLLDKISSLKKIRPVHHARYIRIIYHFQPFDENDMLTSDETPVVDNLFRDGFVSSFTMILLAEIADKTFFIAAIMGTVFH